MGELLVAFATYRLTRLATRDTLLDGPRDWVLRTVYEVAGRAERYRSVSDAVDRTRGGWAKVARDDPRPPTVAELLTCPWCLSIWVALGLVAAGRVAPRTTRAMTVVLSASAVTGLIATTVDR